jgi:hypothetical protein
VPLAMIAPAEFARQIGVSKQGISKAIKAGRIPVYDEAGSRVDGSYTGRKFVKPDEAAPAFRLSRARIDDASLAEISAELEKELDAEAPETPPAGAARADMPPSLASAKTEKEVLQNDLLRLRLAKERGELISRQAQIDAMETAGRVISRDLQAIAFWAEELNGVARSGGVPALSAWLRAKAIDLCAGLADKLAGGLDDTDEPDDPGDGGSIDP